MPRRRSKEADITKRFTFFFLRYLHIYCLISCKIFLVLPSLIDREHNVKMQVLLILKNQEGLNKKEI